MADLQEDWVAPGRDVLNGSNNALSFESSRWLLALDDFHDSCGGVLDK